MYSTKHALDFLKLDYASIIKGVNDKISHLKTRFLKVIECDY